MKARLRYRAPLPVLLTLTLVASCSRSASARVAAECVISGQSLARPEALLDVEPWKSAAAPVRARGARLEVIQAISEFSGASSSTANLGTYWITRQLGIEEIKGRGAPTLTVRYDAPVNCASNKVSDGDLLLCRPGQCQLSVRTRGEVITEMKLDVHPAPDPTASTLRQGLCLSSAYAVAGGAVGVWFLDGPDAVKLGIGHSPEIGDLRWGLTSSSVLTRCALQPTHIDAGMHE